MEKRVWEYSVIETKTDDVDLDDDYVVVFSSLDYQVAHDEKVRLNDLSKLLGNGKFYNLLREQKEER